MRALTAAALRVSPPLTASGGSSVMRGSRVGLAALCAVLATALHLPVAEAAQPELAGEVEFGGGAIVEFVPSGEDAVLVLGEMPDGFSISSLDFVSGAVTKLVSYTYLSRFMPADLPAAELALHFNPLTGLLILAPRSGRTFPLALDITDAPYLTRYRLGVPQDYVVDGIAFLGGKAVLYPRLLSGDGGCSSLLVFRPGEDELKELRPARKFAVVRQILPVGEDERVIIRGYFSPEARGTASELAWLNLGTGGVDVIPGTNQVLLADARAGRLALVRRVDSRTAPADQPAPAFRLELFSLVNLAQPVSSVPLFSRPEWLGLARDGRSVFLVTEAAAEGSNLWHVDCATREKTLARAGAGSARMSPNGAGCFAFVPVENSVELYTLKQ